MKVLKLGQSLCSSGGGGAPAIDLDFVFTVDTTIAGTSGVGFITLPAAGTLNCDIDWGDGTSTTGVTTTVTHDYTATTGAGTYTVRASGTSISFNFNNAGDKLKMGIISNWGIYDLRGTSSFYGCSSMTCTATDAATFTTTDLRNHFRTCALFNGAIGNWATTAFTRMDRCFQSTTAFNQSIGDWDISACTNFNAAFYATALTTDTPTSTANLDAIYIGWESQSVQASQTVDFGSAKYTGGGAAATARAALVAAPNNWTISDGGIA